MEISNTSLLVFHCYFPWKVTPILSD